MKMKDLFKKIEVYNEVANMIGSASVNLHVAVGFGFGYKYPDYRTFKLYINGEYIPEMAKAILNYDGYEIGKTVVECVDRFGDTLSETVDVCI